MFQKEDKVLYVELSDSMGNKRYLLPDKEDILLQLKALLRDYKGIHLVQEGTAKITGDPNYDDVNTIMEIEEIPATVDCLFYVYMPDHPDSINNFARYSASLIELILQKEVNKVSTETSSSLTDELREQVAKPSATVLSLPASSKAPSLTDQLREQVKTPSQPVQISAPLSYPRSSSSSSMNKNTIDEIYGLQLQVIDQITSLTQKVDAVGVGLGAPKQGDPITGEQLEQWFSESAVKVGFTKAFDVLAQRIAGISTEE